MALNFGQIRERYENITGTGISTDMLAGYIDEAQIEISLAYGVRVGLWYPPALTYLSASVEADEVVLPVLSSGELPEPPAQIMLGVGPEAEKITYSTIVGNEITDAVRGNNARRWTEGTALTEIAVAGAEYHLPADILKRHEVRDGGGVDHFNYQITEDNKITFFNSGPHRLIYTKIPEPINKDDNNAVPEVNPVFHRAIVKYCIAQYWEDNADGIAGEENKASKLMAMFYNMVERAARELRDNPNQQHTIGINLW